MSKSKKVKSENTFNILDSSINYLVGSGDVHINSSLDQPGVEHCSASPTGMQEASDIEVPKEAKTTILILTANPKNTSQIRLTQEVRDIQAGLQRVASHNRFLLEQRWAARPKDLQQALLDVQPQIVHFCGHGIDSTYQDSSPTIKRDITQYPEAENITRQEGLVFEDDNGCMTLVNGESLAALFKLFSDQVECVLLNACYSQTQAAAIAEHIAYVIGMKKAISDRAAIEFSVAFYDALSAGKSIDFAFKFACTSLQIAGLAEHSIPILHHLT